MSDNYLHKAKRKDNGKWVEGFPLTDYVTGQCFIHAAGNSVNESDKVHEEGCLKFSAFEVIPETVCRYTGKTYMNAEKAFEGDIFQSQASGDVMILRYGTYQAYCPVDECFMDSVGFYAECGGFPDMPIGDLEDYALKVGSIHDGRGAAVYEDLRGQGLLLKLPCKVGDTVYHTQICNNEPMIIEMEVVCVEPCGAIRNHKGLSEIWNVYTETEYTKEYFKFFDFGKTVFLTQAGAAEALKKMEREEKK